jgi:predicted TIM-barrel fold metal-dependent hydrolase
MDRRGFLALPLAPQALSGSLVARLHQSLTEFQSIDTHEHFPSEATRVKTPIDLFTLVGHYTINDLISAGLSPEHAKKLDDTNLAPARRWNLMEPYWRFVQNTGYGQALRVAIREIYGVAEIAAGTVERINDAIRVQNKPGVYQKLIREKSRIESALNDAIVDPADTPLLVSVRRFDHFLAPDDVPLLEKITGRSIESLTALKRALEERFDRAVRQEGMVAVKCALAYRRDLRFEAAPESAAASKFDTHVKGKSITAGREVVDHMVHYILRLADDYRIPIQVHTGMLSGNGHAVQRTRPTQLVNLLQSYPRVQFDLFHTGFPYQDELLVLVKQFPNAYADFCWTHIISPAAARRALREMLDSVPANKILGFGGDYRYPELSYGHLVLARRNIADVLAERVQAGTVTEDQAAEIGRWLLRDNPAKVFLRRG